jgi:hypothetical protein
LGDWDFKVYGSRPAWANNYQYPISKITRGNEWRCGSSSRVPALHDALSSNLVLPPQKKKLLSMYYVGESYLLKFVVFLTFAGKGFILVSHIQKWDSEKLNNKSQSSIWTHISGSKTCTSQKHHWMKA